MKRHKSLSIGAAVHLQRPIGQLASSAMEGLESWTTVIVVKTQMGRLRLQLLLLIVAPLRDVGDAQLPQLIPLVHISNWHTFSGFLVFCIPLCSEKKLDGAPS